MVVYKVGPTGALVDPTQKRKRKDTRPSARKRGYDKGHEQERTRYLRAHPICEDESGCIEPSTDLDHVDGNPYNRSWGNYRALCGHHHKVRTARDQPGGWHRDQQRG